MTVPNRGFSRCATVPDGEWGAAGSEPSAGATGGGMNLVLINAQKRDRRVVKTGYDWPSFFSTMIFGIPHFIRGQNILGSIFLVLGIASAIIFAFMSPPEDDGWTAFFTNLIGFGFGLGLAIYMGTVGRRLYVKSLIECGYVFENEDSEFTKHYKSKWGIL
jgi:hypothetical protein